MGGKAAAAVLGIVSNALLARLLTPAELGAYFIILSIVTFGTVVGEMGLNRAAWRFVAEGLGVGELGRTRRVTLTMVALGVAGAAVASILYLVFGGLLAGSLFRNSAVILSVTGLVAAWIGVSTVQDLVAEIFRGFHDVRLTTIFGGASTGGSSAGLLMRVLILVCLVPMWTYWGHSSLASVMLVMLGTASVTTLASGWSLYGRIRRLGGREAPAVRAVPLREVLGVSAPLLVSNLSVFVFLQTDVWILAAFQPPQEVAVYGAASRFVALVTMPLMIVNAVLPPIIAELYARGEKDRLERTIRPVATLAGIPSALALLLFAVAGGPILGLVYGHYFASGAAVLAIMSLGKVSAVWSGSCGLTLQMTGHQRTMMWISVSTGILFVVGCLWAARSYGALGVAGVGTAVLIIQNLAMVVAAKRKTGISTQMTLSPAPVLRLLSKPDLRGKDGD